MMAGTSAPSGTPGYGPVAGRVMAVVGACLLMWAAAPLAGYGSLAGPALAGGIVLALVLAATGALDVRRRQICRLASVDLVPVMGGKTAPVVRARRWSLGWPGVPRVVTIRFAPVPGQEQPGWVSQVRDVVAGSFGGTYRLRAHHRRRGAIVFKGASAEGEGSCDQGEGPQGRARRIVIDLLGPSAAVQKFETDEAGAVTGMEVSHQASARLVASGYRARVERTISATLPGRWRGLWDLEADRVRFEQRPALPDCIWVEPPGAPPGDWLAEYESLTIPLGRDEDGGQIVWAPAVIPQALIVGGTGSGKTSLAHNILVHVARLGCPVWIADGKAVEFLGFRDWPNVQIVASSIEEQVAVIHRAWQLMEHRYRLLTAGAAQLADFEPLFLFLDEYADLKGNLLNWYQTVKVKGDPAKPATLGQIASLMRKARTARIHVITATQRGDADILGGEMRENQGMRISVGRLSPDSAQMMWANPAIGVALPRHKRGRAMAPNADGDPVEVQCYRTPDPAKTADGSFERELLEACRPAVAVQDRLLIVPPQATADADTGQVAQSTFSECIDAQWTKASDRPDLDPLARPANSGSPTSGRQMASPMTVLGLADPSHPDSGSGSGLVAVPDSGMSPDRTGADYWQNDTGGGYGDPMSIAADQVQPGDLIDVGGHWAVAEDEPMDVGEDVGVPWRNEDDDGELLVGADELVRVRRPDF